MLYNNVRFYIIIDILFIIFKCVNSYNTTINRKLNTGIPSCLNNPCKPYIASFTSSDLQKYAVCSCILPDGVESAYLTASLCEQSEGDTYLRAYIDSEQIAESDDECGISCGGSVVSFRLNSTQIVDFHEGCFGFASCSGTLMISFTDIIYTPTSSPTVVPTYRPTYAVTAPTPAPTRSPTNPTFLPTKSPTLSPTPVPTLCSVSSDEYNALKALYLSTNGPGWNSDCRKNWNFPSQPDLTAPCTGWNGVLCVSNSDCAIQYLFLDQCNLRGSIPSEISGLSNLWILELIGNRLTGTIPSTFGLMTNLKSLLLMSNSLSGTIPSFLGNMKSMDNLFLWGNKLIGTIPSELGQLSIATALYLSLNQITGTIPSELGNVVKMQILNLEENMLTGTIPSSFGLMTELRQLYLYKNELSGTIPENILNCYKTMQFLDLHGNNLAGTIPQQLGKLTALIYLYLDDNNLSGVIPSGITSPPDLESIDLSNNKRLRGSLDSIFNADFSKSLQYIILSNVMITGTLMASTNQGNSGLNTLVLNALSLGSYCPNKQVFHGSIPSSFFALPNLTDLYLVGNGLTGTLPELGASNLNNINLAYNCITGELPHSIQSHIFDKIDFSSNKLTGTLAGSIQPPKTSFNISINRLSGSIPKQFGAVDSTTIDVVLGNLFACEFKDLNDINKEKVMCGSTALTEPLTSAVVVSCITAAMFIWRCVENKKHLMLGKWWSAANQHLSNESKLHHTRTTLKNIERVGTLSIVLTILIIFMMLLVFLTLKAYKTYVIYEYQYFYTGTAAYFKGDAPIAYMFLWVFFAITMTTMLCLNQGQLNLPIILRIDDYKTLTSGGLSFSAKVKKQDALDFWERLETGALLKQIAVEILIIGMSIGVNISYIYISEYLQPKQLIIIQLAYAFIKLVFCVILIPQATKAIPKNVRQMHCVIMTVVVVLICPAIATIIQSPVCLALKFNPKSIIVSFYRPQITCNNLLGSCEIESFETSESITPEWFYSYQCSSSFLNSYTPTYIFLYVINGFVLPAIYFLMLKWSSRINSVLNANKLMHKLVYQTGLIYLLVEENKPDLELTYTKTDLELSFKNPMSESKVQNETNTISRPVTEPVTEQKSTLGFRPVTEQKSTRGFFTKKPFKLNVTQVTRSFFVDITILLTLGLASPYLAALIAWSMFVNAVIFKLAIGRYICINSKNFNETICYHKLEYAFSELWKTLRMSWWFISVTISTFWSMFLFDMAGDNNHIASGFSAFILMILLSPAVTYYVQKYCSEPLSFESNESVMKFRVQIEKISAKVHDVMFTNLVRCTFGMFLETYENNEIDERPSIVSSDNRPSAPERPNTYELSGRKKRRKLEKKSPDSI